MAVDRQKTGRRIRLGVLLFGAAAAVVLLGIVALRIMASRSETIEAATEKSS